MPIRPENRDRYPDDWKAISQAARGRAGNKCEQCGVENYALIYRGSHGILPAWRYANASAYENSRSPFDGSFLPGTSWDDFDARKGDPVKVVLTVAHLDHQPENCAPENLRCWCQRCHNTYDAGNRRLGISQRAKAARAEGDLFTEDTP